MFSEFQVWFPCLKMTTNIYGNFFSKFRFPIFVTKYILSGEILIVSLAKHHIVYSDESHQGSPFKTELKQETHSYYPLVYVVKLKSSCDLMYSYHCFFWYLENKNHYIVGKNIIIIQLTSVWPIIQVKNIQMSIWSNNWLNFDRLLLSWFLRFRWTQNTAIMKILGWGCLISCKKQQIFKIYFNTIQKIFKLCEYNTVKEMDKNWRRSK